MYPFWLLLLKSVCFILFRLCTWNLWLCNFLCNTEVLNILKAIIFLESYVPFIFFLNAFAWSPGSEPRGGTLKNVPLENIIKLLIYFSKLRKKNCIKIFNFLYYIFITKKDVKNYYIICNIMLVLIFSLENGLAVRNISSYI